MFARSSTIGAQAAMIDAGIGHVRDTVMPAMSHLDGFVGLSLLIERRSGRCIATSAWRTEQNMRASAERVGPIRAAAAQAFGGSAEVEEWEVPILHRAHHARAGSCLRATWGRTDPARLDAVVDTFKLGILPQIEELPGFCSTSLMINRATGRAVVTVGYDDRDAMVGSREPATAIREQTAQAAGMEILEVGEFDLELAHLHIPETV